MVRFWVESIKKGVGELRLYDLLKQVSEILTPETGSFYDFLLSSSENNGYFLLTRGRLEEVIFHMPKDENGFLPATSSRMEILKDREIRDLVKVLICFEKEFKEGDPYYKEGELGGTTITTTLVRLQLFLDSDEDEMIEGNALSSFNDYYDYAYILDLKNKTFSINDYPGVILRKNLIELHLIDGDDRFLGGEFYDAQGESFYLKRFIHEGTFENTVLLARDDLDIPESFICRYRSQGGNKVTFYPHKLDLITRSNCSLLIYNESDAEMEVSISNTVYIIPAGESKHITDIGWGRQ